MTYLYDLEAPLPLSRWVDAIGERRLMRAALEDALRTILGAPDDRKHRRSQQDDLDWITSSDQSHPFTYERICDAIGIDPDWLRSRVLAARDLSRTNPPVAPRMTKEALRALAIRVAGEPSIWRPLLRHDPVSRSHVRLVREADYEVWLLGWTAGQATALHDHGNSAGAFAVVEGTLVEAHVGLRAAVRHTRWRAGSAHAFPAAYLHDVWDPGPAPATSIHVYSPPLSTMTFYERTAEAVRAARTERIDGDAPSGGVHAVG